MDLLDLPNVDGVRPALGWRLPLALTRALRDQWHGPPGRWLQRFDFTGTLIALLFFWWSLTPSLLPRPWYVQSLESALAMVMGYGLGTALTAAARAAHLRPHVEPQWRRAWACLGVLAGVAAPITLLAHASWQRQVRALTDSTQPGTASYFRVFGVALLIAFAAISVLRGAADSVRLVAAPLRRYLPRGVATGVSVVLVSVVGLLLIDGVLAQAMLAAANATFRSADGGNKPGVVRPVDPLRSGSPASLASWDGLGKEGRSFVADGPTQAQLRGFAGPSATVTDPIRVFAGLRSAHSLHDEAALAVRELIRTGAFDRRVLAMATATGRGWVDPQLADPLEYMYAGNTAIVAIQYSYLPSWLSFAVDGTRARTAGRELFDQVYDAWRGRPPDHRPQLVVFGESLGAYGSQAAFRDVNDLHNRVAGALWVGPPDSSSLSRQIATGRAAGSPQRLPVYHGGRTIRYTDDTTPPSALGWSEPRVLIEQHASDPVVWWSWRLLLHEPAWLHERRGPDVLSAMHWYPVVSFFQVTGDLLFSQGATPGHGHRYDEECARGWAAVLPPPGWTSADTEHLAAVMRIEALKARVEKGHRA